MKAYLMCAFASFGGIFFGYDSGYISGVLGMDYVIHTYTGLPYSDRSNADIWTLPSWQKSLIVSILSAGTFFGAIIAGDLADFFGRRTTIISGCGIFIVGVILQVASTSYKLLVAGRLIAGFGVGFVSAIIILYMSEIAPKKVRGGKSMRILNEVYLNLNCISPREWIPVLHHYWPSARILCRLRHSKSPRHWIIQNSNFSSNGLGIDPCSGSLPSP